MSVGYIRHGGRWKVLSKVGVQLQLEYLQYNYVTAAVAEWVRAWDTLTMFEATVCGRS